MDANEIAELRRVAEAAIKGGARTVTPEVVVLALLDEVARLSEAVEFRDAAMKRDAILLGTLGNDLDVALTERDAAVARAEKAEAQVERVRSEVARARVDRGEFADGAVAKVTPCACSAQRTRAEKAEPRPLSTHVSRRAKERRHALGWSAKRLADECSQLGYVGLSESVIANMDVGRRASVSVDDVDVLARALGVTWGWLIRDEHSS